MSSHQIISMERGETKNSKSPMWRCLTMENVKVNIFSHSDPSKDTASLFEAAGYWPFMEPMLVGEQVTWNEFPIPVTLRQNGQWWDIIEVEDCEDARPDSKLVPDAQLYKERAAQWARRLLRTPNVLIWDTETTGVTQDDEIISIAGVSTSGETLFSLLLKPDDLERVSRTTDIHGITPAQLVDAPTFKESCGEIYGWLSNSIWVIYNADYDSSMLEYACMRAGIPPIFPLATVDAMKMFSNFYGEWNPRYQEFGSKGLQFAAQELGIEPNGAHNALDDALTTLEVIKVMAAREPTP